MGSSSPFLPGERRLFAAGGEHVRKVDEHALRSLRAQIHVSRSVSHRAGLRLKHQVELASFGEGVLLATVRARFGIIELVEAVPGLAARAVDERIGEVGQVPGGLPDLRRAQDCGGDQHEVFQTRH